MRMVESVYDASPQSWEAGRGLVVSSLHENNSIVAASSSSEASEGAERLVTYLLPVIVEPLKLQAPRERIGGWEA